MPPGVRMIVGGSAVPESLIRGFARHGVSVLQGWGMTETSPLASGAFVKPELQHFDEEQRIALATTAGVPAPLVDLRIVGDGDKVQPWDGKSVGEIQVRGHFITGSYHNVPKEPDKFTADGWLRTGDVASVDEHGYIRIVDRTKDLIKSGGEWISSVDMENELMGHRVGGGSRSDRRPGREVERAAARVCRVPPGQDRDGRTSCARTSRTSSRSGSCPSASSSSTRSRAPRPASSGRRSCATSTGSGPGRFRRCGSRAGGLVSPPAQRGADFSLPRNCSSNVVVSVNRRFTSQLIEHGSHCPRHAPPVLAIPSRICDAAVDCILAMKNCPALNPSRSRLRFHDRCLVRSEWLAFRTAAAHVP